MECENSVFEPVIGRREANGIIYLTIIFDEVFMGSWIDRLTKLNQRIILVQERAKSMLLSPGFKTDKPAIYEIAILRQEMFCAAGGDLWCKRLPHTKEITNKAASLGFNLLNPEIACISREKISQAYLAAMGIDSLVFMHKPMNSSNGQRNLFGLSRGNHYDGDYHDMLSASDYDPCGGWFPGACFVFLVSQNYL